MVFFPTLFFDKLKCHSNIQRQKNGRFNNGLLTITFWRLSKCLTLNAIVFICHKHKTNDINHPLLMRTDETWFIIYVHRWECMAFYLNKDNNSFRRNLSNKIYVDKTAMIRELNDLLPTDYRFLCVTRPRRFGKTMALSMLNAYYSKGCDSKELFEKLNISKDPTFLEHLNKHNVLWVDMGSLYAKYGGDFLKKLVSCLIDELNEKWPNIIKKDDDLASAIQRINDSTGETFIFLIDEWDVIFREEPNSPLCDDYIMLLRSLFKSSDVSSCFDLVYMTGILPIKRYSTQSALNMFKEYNMLNPRNFAEYIGFTEDEVKELCNKYAMDFGTMKKWYDGYKLKGFEIYNPQSVIEAITLKEFSDYWTSTSAIEAVTNYMNYDNGALKGAITSMLNGEEQSVDVQLFENDLTKVDSQDAALTILTHLGYLAYDENSKTCRIPNYEISLEFESALKKLHWHEAYDPISSSKKLYDETIKGNTAYINEALDRSHKDLASMFNKNKEDVLGIVVSTSYYCLREYYYVRKEDTCATGRADITYTPKDSSHMPIVIELKADDSVDNAIRQIKERDYSDVFKGYKGKVLLLGIAYDSNSLKHDSKIEYIEL